MLAFKYTVYLNCSDCDGRGEVGGWWVERKRDSEMMWFRKI